MRFRPCIDLHQGKVKQIVGATLENGRRVRVNFEARRSADWYARLYRNDGLTGGHVIMLGPGNEEAARQALAAWPQGLQVGGGVDIDNAGAWLEAGAAAVIVTSWLFPGGRFSGQRLAALGRKIGARHLVIDLSCRRRNGRYWVVMDRWRTFTDLPVTPETLDRLAGFCCEFLVHGVDVEGRCQGIENDLVKLLGRWSGRPVTYAGGIRSIEDIRLIEELGRGAVDFTVGSALDIFGGSALKYEQLAAAFGPRPGNCRPVGQDHLRH